MRRSAHRAAWVGTMVVGAWLLGCGSPGDTGAQGELSGVDAAGFQPDAAVGVGDGGVSPDDTIAPDTAPDTTPDTALPDTALPDTTPDTVAPDTVVVDTTPDTVLPDTVVVDTSPDTVLPDTVVVDTSPDTVVPDTVVVDTSPDTVLPDTAVADTAPDTVLPDTTPDTVPPDTTKPDTTKPDTVQDTDAGPDTCVPQCLAKQCGPDGCGDVCGECTVDAVCTDSGQCEKLTGGCTEPGAADTWKTTVGGASIDVLMDLVAVPGGGWAAAGYRVSTFDSNGVQGWLVRLAANGDVIDEDMYGGTGDDRAHAIVRAGDTYLLAGETDDGDFGSWDGWLLAVSSSGAPLWDRSYGGSSSDRFWDLAVVDGGLVITGSRTVPNKGSQLWVVRVDADGDVVWEKTFGDIWSDSGKSVLPVADGVIIGGTFDKVNYATTQAWLVKLGYDGSSKWDEVYDGCRTADDVVPFGGGYVTVGEDYSSITSKGFSLCAVRTDASGGLVWEKTLFDTTGDDRGHGVAVAGSDLVFTGRHSASGSSAQDGLLVLKTTATGSELWSASFGGSGAGEAVRVTTTGHVVVAGTNPGNGDATDGIVLKLAADGLLCEGCGDGSCDPAAEDCASCPQDCGACEDPGPCCVDYATPGCGVLAIEACVCVHDAYCCSTAWDMFCVDGIEQYGCGSCGP